MIVGIHTMTMDGWAPISNAGPQAEIVFDSSRHMVTVASGVNGVGELVLDWTPATCKRITHLLPVSQRGEENGMPDVSLVLVDPHQLNFDAETLSYQSVLFTRQVSTDAKTIRLILMTPAGVIRLTDDKKDTVFSSGGAIPLKKWEADYALMRAARLCSSTLDELKAESTAESHKLQETGL